MEQTLVTATVIGAIVALVLEWFPGLHAKWQPLPEKTKRIYVGIIVLGLNTAAVIASCGGFLTIAECPAGDWQGQVLTAFVAGVWALVTSQGTHQVSKRSIAS